MLYLAFLCMLSPGPVEYWADCRPETPFAFESREACEARIAYWRADKTDPAAQSERRGKSDNGVPYKRRFACLALETSPDEWSDHDPN